MLDAIIAEINANPSKFDWLGSMRPTDWWQLERSMLTIDKKLEALFPDMENINAEFHAKIEAEDAATNASNASNAKFKAYVDLIMAG